MSSSRISSSLLVKQALASFSDEKEWPENAVLYKGSKELLPELAKCYAIEAMLALHDLQHSYCVIRRDNARFMSPRSTLPFLRIGSQVECELDIIGHLKLCGYSLSKDSPATVKLCVSGILSLMELKLVPIELYYTWIDSSNQDETFARYAFNIPNPLNRVLCWRKLYDIRSYLLNTGWLSKKEADIQQELHALMDYFSGKLEKGPCLTGDQVTEADVYLYGHLQAILESNQKNSTLRNSVEKHPRLTQFCLTFNQVHLGNRSLLWEFA